VRVAERQFRRITGHPELAWLVIAVECRGLGSRPTDSIDHQKITEPVTV
jgi:hypothetical protein